MASRWAESALLLIGTEHHELSRMAKDLGAGAVMVSIGLAAIVWGMALFQWWTASR